MSMHLHHWKVDCSCYAYHFKIHCIKLTVVILSIYLPYKMHLFSSFTRGIQNVLEMGSFKDRLWNEKKGWNSVTSMKMNAISSVLTYYVCIGCTLIVLSNIDLKVEKKTQNWMWKDDFLQSFAKVNGLHCLFVVSDKEKVKEKLESSANSIKFIFQLNTCKKSYFDWIGNWIHWRNDVVHDRRIKRNKTDLSNKKARSNPMKWIDIKCIQWNHWIVRKWSGKKKIR